MLLTRIFTGILSYTFNFIKRYPLSLTIVFAVIYLSFFRPPSIRTSITNIDKLAHLLMYGGLSGIIWIEFIRSHNKFGGSISKGWIAAFICPIAFSGIVELLQEYATRHRSGDWMDFAANTIGVILATITIYIIKKKTPLLNKKTSA